MPTSAEWHARAEVWVPAIIRGHPDVVNIDTLWEFTRETEAYVPRQYFREVARELTEIETYTPIINRMGDEELIPRRFYQTTTSQRRSAYTWVVEYTGIDPEIGLGVTDRFTLSSSKSLTLGEIRDESESMIVEDPSKAFMLDFTIEIVSSMHRQGTAW